MRITYIIEQKRAGQFGCSDFLMVEGTHVTISKGTLHVWNADREGRLASRAVASVPLERVVTFKSRSAEARAPMSTRAQVA